jgi:hypothetical protein
MVGEAGMEKLIRSVEEAVTPLATPDPEQDRQERLEVVADEQAAEMRELAEEGPAAVAVTEEDPGAAADNATRFDTGKGAVDGAEALNTLLIGGAQFLMSLSKSIARQAGTPGEVGAASDSDGEPLQKALQGMLGRDETTGKTYLKIPMPEADAIHRVVSGLGQLLSGFMKMNR